VSRPRSIYSLTEPRRPFFYAPIPPVGLPPQGAGVAFFARTASSDPMGGATALRKQAAEVDAAILIALRHDAVQSAGREHQRQRAQHAEL